MSSDASGRLGGVWTKVPYPKHHLLKLHVACDFNPGRSGSVYGYVVERVEEEIASGVPLHEYR